MKAAVLYTVGCLRVVDIETPKPGPGEVLIEVKASTICPTDLRKYLGHTSITFPIILGHEFSGIVTELGEGVNNVAPQDRVTVFPIYSCGTCRYCREERYNLCNKLSGIGGAVELGKKLNGSFAEYIVVRAENIFKLPENVDFEEGALIEPLAAALRGIIQSNVKPGDISLVMGAGPMGLLQVMLLKKMGAAKVIVSDPLPHRRKWARKYGADVTVDPYTEDLGEIVNSETDGYGVDEVIVSVGGSIEAELISQALKFTSKSGTVVVFAGTWPLKYTTIDPNLIHYGERRIVGSFLYTRSIFERALRLAASRTLNLSDMITHRYPLERIEDAFRVVYSREGIKVAVLP
ncbi:MAG: threonine dehydrogenase [Thermoprotei archaeon]|nr:MAG: threonine dehydrogenase [Thermoprotei archaeon]